MTSVVPIPVIGRQISKPFAVNKPAHSISPEAVRKQLRKILRSDGFIHAERMKAFLVFIVEETLAGRSGQLCQYSIGVSVFKRSESFDPAIDPIVRNDARRLRHKLLEYYERVSSQDEQVIIAVPKGGYVPSFSRGGPCHPAITDQQYRLTISLIRIADGAEIWNAQHEFEAGESKNLLQLRLG
jgi:hypothetical protein